MDSYFPRRFRGYEPHAVMQRLAALKRSNNDLYNQNLELLRLLQSVREENRRLRMQLDPEECEGIRR